MASELGMGILRLPLLDEADKSSVDMDAAMRTVDRYLELGGRYFDTAWSYNDGASEAAVKRALVERYPRERFMVCDKIPSWKPRSHDDCWRFLREMMERTGLEYFDVLMMHWLSGEHYETCRAADGFGFLRMMKERGIARAIGFSFHDRAEVLDRILSENEGIDYVLMQINALDWESVSIESRKCLETARRHGVAVNVMEPLKGGTLARDPRTAELALRFVRQQPGIKFVLSGMSSPEQVDANMAASAPLTDAEEAELRERIDAIRSATAVPCTGCKYCISHSKCPKKIPIPKYFSMLNELERSGGADGWKIRPVYAEMTKHEGAAADCVKCRSCERQCPQKIEISRELERVDAALRN